MANIAIFRTGKTPQYLKSVNTPDYESDPNVIVNPDISALGSVPLKYWKREKDNVLEMTQAEKDVVDATALQTQKDNVVLGDDIEALVSVLGTKGISITNTEILTEIKSKITQKEVKTYG